MGNINPKNSSKIEPSPVTINSEVPVYISMSTTPPRIGKTINILDYTLPRIKNVNFVINIPTKYKNYTTNDNFFKNVKELNNLSSKYKNLTVNITPDFGPATKIIPTLNNLPCKSVLIICDDSYYNLDAFKIIAEKQSMNPYKSFSFWTYNYNGFYVGQGADLLSFWGQNALDIKNDLVESSKNEWCFRVDDLSMSFYLRKIGIPIERLNRKWPYPFIPDPNEPPGLFQDQSKYNRDSSMKNCYTFLSK